MLTRCLCMLVSLLALNPAAHGQWQPVLKHAPAIASQGEKPTSTPAPAATVKDGFKIAVGGDLLGPYQARALTGDASISAVARIFQSADAGFANLEGNLFDTWQFKGYPAAENGGFELGGIGSGPLLPKAIAAELRKMGISLVSTANNHSVDFGVEGMFETLQSLEDAGIAHAGSGATLAHARAPAIISTAHGTVALVACASTFLPMAPAGAGGGDGRIARAPRPGIAALRSRPIALVSANELEVLKSIARRQGRLVDPGDTEVTLTPNEAILIQQTFRLSDQPGLTYELQKEDREGLLRAIRFAKQSADLAMYSIHAHETASGGQEFDADPATLKPADFLQTLFHDAVDAGADVVITHGPHVLRGIEIYQGKPIFYGLGSLFFELGTDWRQEWFDSMIAVSEFRDGRVSEVRLYPIVLGTPGEARSRREQGTPRIAKGEDARRILESLRRQSEAYGTRIQIEKEVGVIRFLQR